MKSLTIEQLKSLEVGDWVYIVDIGRQVTTREYRIIENKDTNGLYLQGICFSGFRPYTSLGKDWLAYKNKEMAEAKEKCTICHMNLSNILPKVDKYENKYCNGCYEAKCKLENIKAAKQAKTNGKMVELPEPFIDTSKNAYGKTIYLVYRSRIDVYCPLDDIYLDETKAERRLAELKGEWL